MLDLNAFLEFSHISQILAVGQERELRGVQSLHLHRQPHLRLTQPWVDLLPVQMLLEDDCLHTVWEDAESEAKLFGCCTLEVEAVDALFHSWTETAGVLTVLGLIFGDEVLF